jgi:LPS export ABC transporter protein LptC
MKRLVVTFTILVGMTLISCEGEEVRPDILPIAIAKEVPTQTSWNARLSFSTDGVVRGVLSARRVRVYESERKTLLDSNLKVDFFGADSKHTSVLTADWARINDASKDMTAFDSVKVRSDKGVLVETDSLVWENQTRKVRSDAFVRITEKNGRITTGMGFESDQDLINYRILRPVITAPSSAFENSNASPTFNYSPQVPIGTMNSQSSPIGEDSTK